MSRRALVTGIAGQDGSLLAELLIAAGYEVVGVDRPGFGGTHPDRHRFVPGATRIVGVDLGDPVAVTRLIERERPVDVFHLAASSFVPASWDDPVGTARFAPGSVAVLLDAIRRLDPSIRFLQASSATIFGLPQTSPQSETTPIAPVTPYGAAKAHALFLGRAYRARYGLHASAAILYNHESPRRPEHFLTRKVTKGVAAIKAGRQDVLALGDLDARRDWSYAVDVVRAMQMIVVSDTPGDYVVASGAGHSVGEFAALAFERAGLDWRRHVVTDPSLVRGDVEAPSLVGDASLLRDRVGWRPEVSFEELVAIMVDADVALEQGLA